MGYLIYHLTVAVAMIFSNRCRSCAILVFMRAVAHAGTIRHPTLAKAFSIERIENIFNYRGGGMLTLQSPGRGLLRVHGKGIEELL